jgi:hypothetical protein
LASTPPTNEAFLREVDEELRKDQLQSFWKRWGRWLVGGVVLILAAWGGWIFWEHRQSEAAGLEGEKLSQAIDELQSGSQPAAEVKLKALTASNNEGYRASSKMAEASILMQKGDLAGAAKAFGEVAADASIAQPWRDLATIRQTAAQFDTMKPEDIVARLRPLAVRGQPWFGSAGEMVAAAYLKMNKPDLAGKLYADIGKDEGVPETIRSRAVQMAGSLGVDAVNTAGKEAK